MSCWCDTSSQAVVIVGLRKQDVRFSLKVFQPFDFAARLMPRKVRIRKSPYVRIALNFICLRVPRCVHAVEQEYDLPHLASDALVLHHATLVAKLYRVVHLVASLVIRIEKCAAKDLLGFLPNSVVEPEAVIVRLLPLAVFICEIQPEGRWLGIAFHDEEGKGDAGEVGGFRENYLMLIFFRDPALSSDN